MVSHLLMSHPQLLKKVFSISYNCLYGVKSQKRSLLTNNLCIKLVLLLLLFIYNQSQICLKALYLIVILKYSLQLLNVIYISKWYLASKPQPREPATFSWIASRPIYSTLNSMLCKLCTCNVKLPHRAIFFSERRVCWKQHAYARVNQYKSPPIPSSTSADSRVVTL